DDHGCSAHTLNRGAHVALVVNELRRGNADVETTEHLCRTQLVARVGDAVRRVGAKHIHLLELAHYRRAIQSYRCPNARDDAIVGTEALASVVKVGLRWVRRDGELERVEHPDRM